MQYSCINSIFSLLCMWTSYYYYVIYLMINDWHNVHQKETWIHLTFFHPLALAILLKGLRRPSPLTFLNVQIHHLNYIIGEYFKKCSPPKAKWGQDRPCSHLHLLKIYCSLYRSKLHVSGFHYYSLLVCMTNDIKIDKRLILLPLLYNYYTDIQICDSLQKNYEDDICFCLQGSMPCRL